MPGRGETCGRSAPRHPCDHHRLPETKERRKASGYLGRSLPDDTLYKDRESVKGGFDTGKNRLDLDRTYSMTMRAEAGMTAKPSPEGLQRKYASVYSLRSPNPELVYDVGADVKKLDKTLKLNLYQ